MFNLIELFQPGRKHTDDEQKRLELSRVDVADGDPGHGPIDLTSGKVVVRLPHQPSPAPTTADDDGPLSPTATPHPAPKAGPDPAPGPSPER